MTMTMAMRIAIASHDNLAQEQPFQRTRSGVQRNTCIPKLQFVFGFDDDGVSSSCCCTLSSYCVFVRNACRRVRFCPLKLYAISRNSWACAGFCIVHWSQQTTLCLMYSMAWHRSGLVVIHWLCFFGVHRRCILWKCGLSARLEVTSWKQIMRTDVGTVHS